MKETIRFIRLIFASPFLICGIAFVFLALVLMGVKKSDEVVDFLTNSR